MRKANQRISYLLSIKFSTIDDKSNIKIYFQKKKVLYADYIPRKFYVSVHEVIQL